MIDLKKLEALLKDGLSNTKIAKEFGVHRTTIAKIIKKNGFVTSEKIKRGDKVKCIGCDNKTTSRRKRCDTCNTKIRRFRAKKASVEYLGGRCNRCGWVGDLSGYDFHHKNPNSKTFTPDAANLANKSWEKVREELDKCELLCALCHRLEHSDYNNKLISDIANEENNDLIFKKHPIE